MEWAQMLQAFNTAALAAVAVALAKGYLVPLSVVREHMIAPLNARIDALENVSRRREDQTAELQKLQAQAIAAQSEALSIMHKGRD